MEKRQASLLPDNIEKLAKNISLKGYDYNSVVDIIITIIKSGFGIVEPPHQDGENIETYVGTDPYIFISYPHADKTTVTSILLKLWHDGYRLWYDAGIPPAEEFESVIFQSMKDSAIVLFFLSDAFFKSDWCKKELKECLKLGKEFFFCCLDFNEVNEKDLKEKLELNEEQSKFVFAKRHLFWSEYDNKLKFYQELEKHESYETILNKTRSGIVHDSEAPLFKYIYPCDGIKKVYDDTLVFSDKVAFGKYPTGSNGEIGDIIWRVIAEKNDRILLVSEYLIDAMYFHDKNEPANWETCTLRRWLNSDFYQKAFNENERQLVISDYIETSENWMFETNSGSQVENAVFLLSVEEIYQYFMENPHCQYKQTKKFQEVGPKDFMKAKYTEYAKAKSSYVDNDNNEYGWWWLRTSGEKKGNLTNATMITTGPYLNMKGVSVKFPVDGDKPAGGVRPAIWIRRQLS